MPEQVVPYLPPDIAELLPSPVSEPFWDRCARRQLCFQRCSECRTFRHPPAPLCPRCRSFATEWQEVDGSGTVYTFTVVQHPVHPALRDVVPYNVVVVEFPDAPGVRLISNLVDAGQDPITVGLEVELVWDRVGDMFLPRFRRRG